jgi:peptidoglycan/xylan/chitin deacetylase (PgdA/CDA1 family)
MPAIRIDRVLTTAVFQPFCRAGFSTRAPRLPVLMYHSLCADPENGVSAYYKTNTSPAVFREQMRQLAESGYHTVDLEHVAAWLNGGPPLPEKSFVITFDDGFQDFYTDGFPVLQEHGFTAAMFLPTAFIGDERRTFQGTTCLTWSEVRELRAAGIVFGSHTVNHPELVRLSRPEIERELVDSKAEIEQQIGVSVVTFAYPYAFPQGKRTFVQQFLEALAGAGYRCGVTTELGRVKQGDDPLRIKRMPVNALDDGAFLKAKLEGGYDWVAVPQGVLKAAKGSME